MIASAAIAEAERILRQARPAPTVAPIHDGADAIIFLLHARALLRSRYPEVRAIGQVMLDRAIEALS